MSGTSTPVLGHSSSAMAINASSPPTSALSAHLGATRNRTLLFQSYRDSVPRPSRHPPAAERSSYERDEPHDPKGKGKRKAGGTYFDADGRLGTEGGQDEENFGLLDNAASIQGASTKVDMSSLPPKWVDTSDEVDAILANLKPRIAHLDRLHAKHVLPGFTDRTNEEREIQAVTTEITRDFRKCSKLISSLASTTASQQRAGRISSRELAMAHNVQTALATKVQDASAIFRKKQANYMQRLRGLEVKHSEVAGMGMGAGNGGMNARSKEGEMALREDLELSRQQLASPASRTHQSQSQLLLDEEAAPVALDEQIADRDREIQRIAKSIAELAELFQDLSTLVIDQGTMLDRIDFNIETMGREMEGAVVELNRATHYQSRTSRGQCILFLLLCIALLIAILIIKPFWRLFSSPAPPVMPPAAPPVPPTPPTGGDAMAALRGRGFWDV